MQEYQVVLADDHEMPRGMDWAIARRTGGGMVAFLRRSRICAEMLEEAWAAADECRQPPRRQRVTAA